MIHALCSNHQPGVVRPLRQASLNQIPQRELEVFARSSSQVFQLRHKQPRRVDFEPSSGVEHLEYRQPNVLLDLEVVFRLGAGTHQAPSLLLFLAVQNVVLRALFRIAQNLVSIANLTKPGCVAGLLIVRVKALREKTIDAVDRIRLRVGVDLQYFVVIGRGFFVRHQASRLGLTLISARARNPGSATFARRAGTCSHAKAQTAGNVCTLVLFRHPLRRPPSKPMVEV